MKKTLLVTLFALTGCSAMAQTPSDCDSLPDRTSEIRTLLDSSPSLVLNSNEVYSLSNLALNSDETLSGGATICKPSTADAAIVIQGAHSRVQNLHFRPAIVSGQPNCDIKIGEGAQQVSVTDNTFAGNSYSAICAATDTAAGGVAYAVPASGVQIGGNTFTGYVRPTFLHSVENITLTDNIYRDTQRDAIRLRENDGFVIISTNQFINIGDGTTSDTQDAIDTLWSGNRLIISNNIVRNTQSVGFDIKGRDDASGIGSSSVIISGNHITGTRYSAVVLHGDLNSGSMNRTVSVTDNIFEANGQAQSYADAALWIKGALRQVVINDNQFIQNYGRGITVQTRTGLNDGSVGSIQLQGNILINNGVATAPSSLGIYLSGVAEAQISGNTIGNNITLANPTTTFGIVTNRVNNAIITNNILRCITNTALSLNGENIIEFANMVVQDVCQQP